MTHVYAHGLVHLSVCSDEPVDEMLKKVNENDPTGLTHPWQLSDEPTFAQGLPNPTPCERETPGAWHYLLVC